MASRNHATAVRNTTTKPANTVVRIPNGIKKEDVKGLLGELLLEALTHTSSNPLSDTDVHQPTINTEAANDRDINLATSPADAFFSDVRPNTKGANHSSRDERVKEAVSVLREAQRVLAFTNPDLKGKTRAWGRNNETRKKALETVDQLVNSALRTLGSA
jgi:hypothetical protein